MFFHCAGAQQTMLIWAKNSTLLKRETMSLNYSSLMMTKWGSDTKQPSERFCKLLASFFAFSTLGAEKSKLMTLDNTCMISKCNCMIFSSSWMITVCFLAQQTFQILSSTTESLGNSNAYKYMYFVYYLFSGFSNAGIIRTWVLLFEGQYNFQNM